MSYLTNFTLNSILTEFINLSSKITLKYTQNRYNNVTNNPTKILYICL